MPWVSASVGDDIGSFFAAVGKFFENLARIDPALLALGLLCFGIYLTFRARAFFHVLQAAYPAERVAFRRIWGAYIAAYGFNNVIPARGGDIIKLFLTRTSIPSSSYPAIGAALFVEAGFDLAMGIPILIGAFDLSFLAQNLRLTLFLITLVALGGLIAFAVLSVRVKAFWGRVRQGLTILADRRRYLREVFLVQFAGWLFRCAAFWSLLEAFNVGGSVKNVLLVLGVNAVASALPFTPGGAGVQQAFLVKVFAGTASGATIAAYSVGQQIAIALFSIGVGFLAIVTIFKFRSFKEVVAAGKDARAAEKAAAV